MNKVWLGLITVGVVAVVAGVVFFFLSGSGSSRIQGQLVGSPSQVGYSSVVVELFKPRVQSCAFESTEAQVESDGSFSLPLEVTDSEGARDDCVFDFGFRLNTEAEVAFVSGQTKTVTTVLPNGETYVLPTWEVKDKGARQDPPSSVDLDTGGSGMFDYDPEMCESLRLQYDINKRLSDDGFQDDFTDEYRRFMDLYNCP